MVSRTRQRIGKEITVYRTGAEPAVKFAATELARYLSEMLGTIVRTEWSRTYDETRDGFWVATAQRLGDAVPQDKLRAGDFFDDAIYVQCAGAGGIISGSNGRSVLFATYRYLEALGCRWFRPGRDGEYVPDLKSAPRRSISMLERPSARHRCICIEGSCSVKHVRDMIDYAARRGFNAYFLQFRNAYTFFQRWYGQENPNGRVDYTPADADRAWERVKAEVRRRGLILHSVGHGWTCEPFGIAGLEWKPTTETVPKQSVCYLAKVDGRRRLWGGVPLNTNLCYSNPRVRKIMAAAVADYAEEHPDEALVHVWLADGSNNQCECANCKRARPSDFYVQLLNQIDALLSARELETRIVFLAYVDLLWAPRKENIENPDRFVLMFAPITRSYAQPLLGDRAAKQKAGGRTPPYRRNRLQFPSETAQNMRFLDEWRKSFTGECVDFDYHLMFDPTWDPSGMEIVPVLHRDVRDLEAMGMDGFISCQRTRVAFPTGIAMHVMGRTLWDREVDYENMVSKYFSDLFGKDGASVRRYLTKLGRLSAVGVLRGERPYDINEVTPKLLSMQGMIEKFSSTIEANVARLEGLKPPVRERLKFQAAAWDLLQEHTYFMIGIKQLVLFSDPRFVAEGEAMIKEGFEGMGRELRRRCRKLHHVIDGFYTMRMIGRMLNRFGYDFPK